MSWCRLIAALGCLNHCIGFGAVWLAAMHYVSLPYWLLCAFALLGSSAVVFFDSATIVTCMRNFPNERGNVGGGIRMETSVSLIKVFCRMDAADLLALEFDVKIGGAAN